MDAGIRSSGNGIEYLWFRTDDNRMRLLALNRLAYVPVAAREDPDVLGKAWAMLRGLYAARVDFAYVAAGIWSPRPVGILQFYGALAEGPDEESAREELRRRMKAVLATFRAAYPQSRLVAAETDDLRWILEAINHFPHAIALLGQPSPRAAPRGLGRDGKMGTADDEFASQQNEILFRGLAALKRDFLFQVFSSPLNRLDLARQLEEIAYDASLWASRVRGTRSFGFSVGVPVVGAVARAAAAGRGYATSDANSTSHTDSHSTGTAHTKAWSHTDSYVRSEGGFESWGTATTSGTSYTRSVAHTDSQSTTDGTAHTKMQSTTDSVAHTSGSSTSTTTTSGSSWGVVETVSNGWSAGVSSGVSQSHTDGTAHTASSAHSITSSDSTSTYMGRTESHVDSFGVSASGNVRAGASVAPVGIGLDADLGMGVGVSRSHAVGEATTTGTTIGNTRAVGMVEGSASTASSSDTVGTHAGWSVGMSGGHSVSSSSGGFSSTSTSSSSFSSTTTGHAETRGTADTTSHAETRGTAATTGESWGSFSSTTNSYSQGRSWSVAEGHADSYGEADTISEASGVADTVGKTESVTRAQQTSEAQTHGWSFGIIPTWNITRSWQVEEDQIDQVARLERLVESMLERGVAEGAYRVSTFLLLRHEDAVKAATALAISAFHGADVPTPVIPVVGNSCADRHARVFEPCRCPDPLKHPLGGTALGSVLTFEQVAAYIAPGLFEEGAATTMQEALPPLAFYPPSRQDGILLGHQFSPETGDLTDSPLLLPRDRYSHAAFVADTRFGKSVAAERLALESTIAWQMRTIVLDFGAGWRKLLNAPQLSGHVDFYSLSPGSPRPLCWNPLQIGRRIHPETQWRAFCDIFSAISRMGVRRQGPELREALRQVYLRAGVLVDDPALSPGWQKVLPEEADIIRQARAERGLPDEDRTGWPLAALDAFERQAIAVHRSRAVGLPDLYAEIERKLASIPPRDTTMRGVLEGILYRLHPLVQGAAARQYAPGHNTALEDLALPWGLVIVEGGADLDEFSKAFLLGWLAWLLWRDAVARRQAGQSLQPMQIIFEEANKILNGPQVASDEESGGGDYLAEQFALMWRDSAKYQCFLHVIAQSPSLLPRGILSSCSLVFVGQLKDPNDTKIAMAMLERSEVGFVDEPYRRLIRRLGVGQFLCRMAYGEMAQLEPVLIRPAMVRLPEPSDEEIRQMFL
ncbi:MAG: serine-rich protein [Anaerolineae bacterium]